MPRSTPTSPAAGFALAEALVALLLLAFATIGAGTALVQSLAGQRSALLRTRAADLAADLAEALRAAPDPEAREREILAWHSTVQLVLPQAQSYAGTASAPGAGFEIRIQWREGSTGAGSTLVLPISPGSATVKP